MRLLDLRKKKKESGIHCYILPRGCGKTTNIIKNLETNDLYISKNSYRQELWKKRTEQRFFYFLELHYLSIQSIRGHFLNTIFIDEFELYNQNNLVEFIEDSIIVCKSIILIGTNRQPEDVYFCNAEWYNRFIQNFLKIPKNFFEI